jgi:hypothetical protein
MQLTQTKLTKKEWEGIEVPSSPQEKRIITLIQRGFEQTDYSENVGQTILDVTKIQKNDDVEKYLYIRYFKEKIDRFYAEHKIQNVNAIESNFKPKKRDLIRMENSEKMINDKVREIGEFVILEALAQFSKYILKNAEKWQKWFYTMVSLHKTIQTANKYLRIDIDHIISVFTPQCSMEYIINNAQEIIEHNEICENFKQLELYNHQKELFNLFKTHNTESPGKLVFYVAPTGTGKTMSPLGLAEKYRVIFVCAARHIGTALAKHAISGGKKIALAFGCEDVDQVRLHYSAAKEFVKHRRTGGIFKVDNSVGDKVEIMICDIKSYLVAMRYMLAFNKAENIILYWDEPTISMDYEDHDFHPIIQENWRENKIPNIVLSSATLPHFDEIPNTVQDYVARFSGTFHSIISNHSKNSVAILSKDNHVVLPHHLCETHSEMTKCVQHCKTQSSLLRYMDLNEITKFLGYVRAHSEELLRPSAPSYETSFEDIGAIDINSIKEFYLDMFRFIKKDCWKTIYDHFKACQTQMYNSSVYLTTKDAHTITHGPCIYLANNVEKVAKFLYQQSKIPEHVVENINKTIASNAKINEDIARIEKAVEDMTANENPDKDIDDDKYRDSTPRKLLGQADALSARLKAIHLPEDYIPNHKVHYKRYVNPKISLVDCSDVQGLKDSFKISITNMDVMNIMRIVNVENYWKTLALMGVGCFQSNPDVNYLETIKDLVVAQKMMLVIASSDYIYGTNYQFSHGYIGKDLSEITQEKLIQAMGRVGRNSSSHTYTIRFRDDALIKRIFTKLDMKHESFTMNKLFS